MPKDHLPLYYEVLHQAAHQITQVAKKSLPNTTVRDFMVWILDKTNPHLENYLRMLGVAGSIELELKLFETILQPSTLKKIAPYISLLNSYFGFETLSDNLGVGLSPAYQKHNELHQAQKKVLLSFNKAMIKKINGFTKKTQTLFTSVESLIDQISVNNQTLSPKQMHQFCKEYCDYNPHASHQELEYSFLSILILNIETCLQLLNSLNHNPIHELLKNSLVDRYASVNRILIASSRASLKQLANLGLKSILTIPTLAYCIGALEEVEPHRAFKEVIKNGLLYKCTADAALLTRLLNDMGTHLLEMNTDERQQLYKQFQQHLNEYKYNTIFTYLLALSEHKEFYYSLTRIRKDLNYGEFNVCLDGLSHNQSINESFIKFCMSIDYYAKLYQQKYQMMLKNLDVLSETLGDNQASAIIHNFVYFHKYKYSHSFDSMQGDYAITAIKKGAQAWPAVYNKKSKH